MTFAWTNRGSALLILCAVALSLWVVAANRAALFYFDSAAYLERGETLLVMAGLAAEAPPDDAAGPEGDGPAVEDAGVDGTRSAVYSLLVALFARTVGLEAVLLANAALAVAAIWLCARVVLRVHEVRLTAAAVTLAAVAAASLGSLPFYVAFLMPDIFAPVLLLMAALLTAYAGRMTWPELLLATVFGTAAVLAHLSHQAIVVLLVPLSLLTALLFARRRALLAPALIALMALVGMAEQAAFRKAVQTVQKAEVVVLPFMTARLIHDGVGYAYLERHCPDAEIPTCSLWEALQRSDDPMRLTATHIAFEMSERLGSYQLMSADDKRAVSRAQDDFFLDVLREDPLGVALAFLTNTLVQAGKNSVDMTLPSGPVMERNAEIDDFVFLEVEAGALVTDQGWLDPATTAQQALYGLATLVLVAAAAWPATPGPLRAFLLMVLLGVLVNAFVCGAVSQPATRYGSRVIWILPAAAIIALAAILSLARARSRQSKLAEAG